MIEKELKDRGGYKPRHIPVGTDYCVYCHGVGCDRCSGRGFYCPDTQIPIYPTPAQQSGV